MTEVTATGGDSLRKGLFHSPQRLPVWLRRSVPRGPQVERVRRVMSAYRLHSVCEAAACPNRLECYGQGRVTFMILGDVCTRRCAYCRVTTGRPLPPDSDEPERVAAAAEALGITHAVVTSVSRDDLPDGGAAQFAATISALRSRSAHMTVEVLVPDFRGSLGALQTVLEARPSVLGHNVETVPRLYAQLRPQGKYKWAVELLQNAKSIAPDTPTKTGLMVGLGERELEIVTALEDLRRVGCDAITLGQYMQPSLNHHPVQRYLTPEEFSRLEDMCRGRGFSRIAAGPLVRSSYMADHDFAKHVRGHLSGHDPPAHAYAGRAILHTRSQSIEEQNMSPEQAILGIPRELTAGERRVAATPNICEKYAAMGMHVLVEASAGEGAFFGNDDYRGAGAEIVGDVEELYGRANVVLKVKEPLANRSKGKHEVEMMRPDATLICFLHPASPLNHDLVRRLKDRGITALTMDSIPRITRAQKMDALTAMSTVAGYKAVIMAADRFSRFIPMTMTAIGMIPPAKVLVIGTGIVGLQAIATAKRLGGVVTAVDIRAEAREQAASLGAKVGGFEVPAELATGEGGYAKALPDEWLVKERDFLAPLIADSDIVFGGALVPGEMAPVIITEDMVKSMRNGSIICDVSVDQGGNCSLTRFNEEVWEHGVLISGIANLPGYVPTDSTAMYANAVYSFVEQLVREGRVVIDRSDEIVNSTLVTIGGEIVHHGTLKAMGLAQ